MLEIFEKLADLFALVSVGRPRADQKTPLHLLCELIALEGYCNGPTPCTCEDLLECAEVLLGHTSAILAKDENGRSVLNVLLDSAYRTDVFTKEAHQYTNDVVSQALLIRLLNKFPETPIQNLRRKKQSALGVATFVNNTALALRLIELGSDVDAQDMAHPSERSFTTPIQRLCSSENSDLCVVDAALRRTRNLTQLDGWDQGLLHQAARIGLPHGSALIHLLVDAGVPVNMKNSNGLTPLMNAIRDGSVETVKTLLTRGADPSVRDNQRWTAFTEACFHGKTEMVEIFFGAGASWDFVRLAVLDEREGSQWWVSVVGPTQLAAYSGHLTLLGKLLQWENDGCMRLECSKGPSPLWLCSWRNHKDIAQVLIKRNSDVDYTYAAEQTSCLQIAATAGSIAVMEILITAGCNIHAEDTTRRTALVHATLADQKEAIALLSKHSQDHAAPASRQQLEGVARIEAYSPQASSEQLFSGPYLLELIKNGDLAGVKQLHVRGTNVERPFSCNACTPLLIALAWDQLYIAEYLLDQDCEVNTGDWTCHVHTEQSSNCAELATISADRLHLLRRILFAIQSADKYLEQKAQLLSDLICLADFCGNLLALQELLETRVLDDVANIKEIQGRRRIQNPVPIPSRSRGTTPLPYDWDHSPRRRLYDFSSIPLLAANEGDQPEALSILLPAGVQIDAVDRYSRTALHTAVYDRNEKVAKLLVDHGCNPSVCERDRFTPAHIAARNGHMEMLDLLSSYGANLTGMMEVLPTVLQEAVIAHRLDTAHALLSRGYEFRENATTCSDLISIESSWGSMNALTFVLGSHSHFEACNYLHSWQQDTFSTWYHKCIVKRLGLYTLLYNLTFSCARDNDGIRGKNLTVLHQSALGEIDTMALVLAAGALVNMECGKLGTPLMYACEAGRMQNAKLLIRHGALVSYKKNAKVFSAIRAAHYFPEIIRWILVERFMDQRKLTLPSGSDQDPSTTPAARRAETYAPATSAGFVPWDTTELIACEHVDAFVRRTLDSMQVGPFYCREDGSIERNLV